MAHTHSVLDKPGQVAGIAAIAAFTGAVVAMLFTPRRGDEVRAEVRQRTMNAKSKAVGRLHRSHDSLSDVVDDTREDVGDSLAAAKTRMRSTAAKVKDDAKATKADVKATTKRTARRTKDHTDDIRRNGEP